MHHLAHKEAYRADVIHRDISPGNILITEDGHGLLIDWDLCKRVSKLEAGALQNERTASLSRPSSGVTILILTLCRELGSLWPPDS
jgi:serine/threonine protein kinase